MLNNSYKIFQIAIRFEGIKLVRIGLIFALVALVWSGCDKPDQNIDAGRLNLSFSARYGTQPFEALMPYGYGPVRSIKLSKLDFYITGITLLSTSGNVELDAVGLIDITGGNDQDRSVSLTGLKTWDYTGIRFMVGVKPDLNKKLPKDFKSNHPLSSASHYWEAWNSYIFSKIEGVLDTKGDKVYDLGFAVHTGTDACLEPVEIIKSFSLADAQAFALNLDLDVEKIFLTNGLYFDLESSPLNHNPSNIATLQLFAAHLADAIQLKN